MSRDRCSGCGVRRLSAWTPLLPYPAITTGNTHKRLCGACGAVEYGTPKQEKIA